MKNYRNIAMLTATITPPSGVPGLARTDPAVRLADYRSALDFYMSCFDRGLDSIVFADNSNSDVSSLHELVASRRARRPS